MLGTWALDVKKTVDYSGLGGALTEKGRNAWSKELEDSTADVAYKFSGSDYTVSSQEGTIEGTVTQIREKEGRFTLELRKGDGVERVRVWFDGSEMFMEQHHQTMVFNRK